MRFVSARYCYKVCYLQWSISTWIKKCTKSVRSALFKWHKLSITNIHCVMCVHRFRCNPTSNDVDQISGMSIWIQAIDASQKFFSYFVSILSVRSDAWWLRFFMTRHLPLSTVIRHVRDILNDLAVGVNTLCLTFHGFRLLGHVYDFVWAMSVTHEGCLYPDVILQKKQAMNLRAEIRHQPFGSYTIEDGIFSMYLYITVSGVFKVGGGPRQDCKGRPSDDVIILSQPWQTLLVKPKIWPPKDTFLRLRHD